MDRNAYRDDDDTDQPDSYWRRRAITLAAGLALLGLLAWAFSGGGGKPANPAAKNSPASGVMPAAAYSHPASPSSGASPSGAGLSGAGPSGAGPSGNALAGRAPGALSPQVSQGPGAGRSGSGKSASPDSTAQLPGSGASSGSGVLPGGGCAPRAVVLSLFSAKPGYRGGQYPEFDVYAVSTASRTCSFNLGPARFHVVVMSSGRVIWDSADCTRGQPARTAELRRGIPVRKAFTWNRSISLPGCVTLVSSARAGTYQVQARAASLASPVRRFKLVR